MPSWVGADLETWGEDPAFALQPWRAISDEAWVTSIAYTEPSKNNKPVAWYLPATEDIKIWLIEQAQQGNRLVTSNGIFDIAWLIALGLEEEVRACKWLDIILLWKRLDAHRYTYGLKDAVKEFLPRFAGYGDDVDFNPDSDESIADLLKYNRFDAGLTLKLALLWWAELDADERRGALIEASGLVDFADSWVRGIPMDDAYLFTLRQELNKELLDTIYNLNCSLCDDELDELEDAETVIASPAKLGALLYDTWGLPVIKETEKGNRSTDKETLIKLAVDYPRADMIRRIRKAKIRLAKFVESPISSIEYNPDGCAHPAPRIAGTYTGRVTYSSKQGKGKTEVPTGIALHQWERDVYIRKSIVPPEGYLLAEFDFSGQEMRLMADRVAVLTGDTTMLDLFNRGIDMHSHMGSGIANVEYDWMIEHKETDKAAKQGRYLGKFANLSLQYRVGIDTMRARALTQYDLWLSNIDAKRIKQMYLKTYPGIPAYWQQAIHLAKMTGYAETLGHRRVALWNLAVYKQQQTAINTPIQGTGADMKALALAIISSTLRKMKIKYAFDLHDALFVFVPDNAEAMDNCLDVRYRLSHLPYKRAWGWEPTLSLPVDGSIGNRWGNMRGVK